MSAEKIITQIKKDSEKQIKEILKEAEKKAEEISKEGEKEAKKKAEAILADGKKQSENVKKILVSKANQDNKKELLSAQEKIIEECFIKAHHKLSTLKEKEYSDIVTSLIDDGVKKLGTDCSVLISRDIDRKIVEKKGIKISGKIESSGGIFFRSKDEKITLDYTFDGILKREKNKIRIKVGKLLFSKNLE